MSMEPMEFVKQTATTIIFEEFDKGRDSLVTLLTRDNDLIPPDQFRNELMGPGSPFVVKDFEDFMKKFAPAIYESTYDQDGEIRFRYTLEDPGYGCRKIDLSEHAFFQMVMNLLDRKAGAGEGNLEFPYDELKEALTPQAQMREYKRLRQNLSSNWRQYQKLLASGEPSAELDRFEENVGANLTRVISNYVNDSPLGMLPLLIADTQAKIDSIKADQDDTGEDAGNIRPCMMELDNQGNLKLLPMPEASTQLGDGREVSADNTLALAEQIREDYRHSAPASLQGNNYVQEMIVSVFTPAQMQRVSSDQLPALQESKKRNQKIYADSLASFTTAVTAVVEKLAGVRTFFDHATHKGKLPADVKIIIANCRADAIVGSPDAKRRFKEYFVDRLSKEKDVNRIWFGVLPGVAVDEDQKEEGGDGPRSTFGRGSRHAAPKKSAGAPVSQSAAREMLDLLKDARIMTFLSCKASKDTGFMNLSENQVKKYRDAFGNFDNDYAVFAYPNFTILPEERSTVKIGTELNEYNEEVNKSLRIPGIYLDAAYAAAGMTVGIQNYKMLQDLGFKVNPQYPSVRFDMEEGDNAKRVLTHLNRETTTEMEPAALDAILEDRFGFAFGDNKIVYNGAAIKQCYVLNARTLRKRDGKYQSIYKTLVRDLVDVILRSLSATVTKSSVNEFLSDYVATWKNDNRDQERFYANRILLKNEDIRLMDENPPQLAVRFNKSEEVWSEIKILSEEADGSGDKES